MPRSLALDVLDAVLRRKRPLDEAFESHPRLRTLEPRDRAFARALAWGVLRRAGQLDDLIGRALNSPLPAKARQTHDVLRLGAFQILFLETPAHAAVNTSVDLAQKHGCGPYKKLVNAVLRRLTREGKAWRAVQDEALLNTPDWLWRIWSETYGQETARAMARAHLNEPPLDLSIAKGDPHDWATRLDGAALPTGSVRLRPGGPITALEGFADGAWWVQDVAATLPGRLLGDVAGLSVIDLCAAPGGKTCQLAASGARVTAIDRSENRLRKVKENLDRLRLEADIVAADARTWRPSTPADALLLDAPCSATGTIRRHPDVPHVKTPQDIARLTQTQRQLLDGARDMVRPGGLLVYCTCSLQPEEGEAQIAAFLDAEPGFAREAIDPTELSLPVGALSANGELRTLPHFQPDSVPGAPPISSVESGGMDGFYAARLRRL
ncbi:16S rRNA (cytosine(967)-C(5))-methyltransferase RsmB [Varunaivibrio sulfuroxidans]|uniref:16S rRNA (cytosine(967)-C(5))-methyltransferase n=1 Tax=Varunaivibrio sulfuroxidans TaxID=1773489 RepID=A0A4R3JHK2_9PROT|nr:16S rRNA (cytosine(967)-C(5))-methyltransferase RsmB [Varunaivibrio sulfuroxidans]TCS64823.1 16S rRNA (cytosine967-C5)-methyltransferase [Varunaivibrio sulfuroxidans]WES29876.1 16S rRNA (cytosine(967)-C(5))-methyltransferase RsmB [Varunaivibrio sulfuroxidans]